MGTGSTVQGLLDRSRQPGGPGKLQEAQIPIHGQGSTGTRRVSGRLKLHAEHGAARLQAHQIPLYQRILMDGASPFALIGERHLG